MIRSLYTAATGMQAQQINQDVVANNLANVQTPGFKASRAEFQDLMYQIHRQAGVQTTSGTALPLGVEVGLGSKMTVDPEGLHPGRLPADRKPLRLGHRGRRLLPGR